MNENVCFLKVILNHVEEKSLSDIKFNVYTLTDYSSGKNFDVWSRIKIDFLDHMKLFVEVKTIKFEVCIVNDNKIKLRPLEVVKGA